MIKTILKQCSELTLTKLDCSEDKCVESCEQGWEKNGDHCYSWNIAWSAKKNWTDAEDFCQKEGGHLASITSNATNQDVVEKVERTGLSHVWFGGNDIAEEGAWKWTDCSPWEFTLWYRGQPNNVGGNQNCLVNWLESGKGRYGDQACDHVAAFVCSKRICTGEKARIDYHR